MFILSFYILCDLKLI